MKFINEERDQKFNLITSVEVTITEEYLPDILDSFKGFLRACGFVFSDIEVVNYEEE